MNACCDRILIKCPGRRGNYRWSDLKVIRASCPVCLTVWLPCTDCQGRGSFPGPPPCVGNCEYGWKPQPIDPTKLSPIGIDEDHLAKMRKQFAISHEEMLEVAAQLFRCAQCRREYKGSQCFYHMLGVQHGEFVSLDRPWVLQCPHCRGEMIPLNPKPGILRFFPTFTKPN